MRESGDFPSDAGLQKMLFERRPICFAMAYNLPKEINQGEHDKASFLRIINDPRVCK
jgi:hypothetical protein